MVITIVLHMTILHTFGALSDILSSQSALLYLYLVITLEMAPYVFDVRFRVLYILGSYHVIPLSLEFLYDGIYAFEIGKISNEKLNLLEDFLHYLNKVETVLLYVLGVLNTNELAGEFIANNFSVQQGGVQ